MGRFNLDNKVVFLTGASGMLGKRYGKALLASGAKVVSIDLDANAVQTDNQLNIRCDISKKEEISHAVQKAIDSFDKIDVLINNAALDPKFDKESARANSNSFENYPFELWERSVSVNLTGTFLCCQVVGQLMVQQGFGNIINVSSTYGLVGPDQRIYKKERENEQLLFKPPDYSVTKAGVAQLTRYLATYWGRKGIRVNSLSPGGVSNNQDEEFVEKYSSRVPMGRMAHRDEMTGPLIFLASDASSYMTGSNLVVDGGWTAW